jgi:heptaprenyl diphosphate synthase
MLSRVSIRRDLRIPGGFGELIGESFRIFAIIMDSRQRITRKNLMGDIDALMIELSEDAPAAGQEASVPGEGVVASREEIPERSAAPVPKTGTTVAGYIILTLTVILSWLPLIFMLILTLSK